MPVAVIMCVYTLDRLDTIESGLRSVLAQEPAPEQVIVVSDHNEDLAALLADRFPDVHVVPNDGPPGLSAARNTGIRNASQPIVAFIDDDAEAAPGWIAGLIRPFDDPGVLGVGGKV